MRNPIFAAVLLLLTLSSLPAAEEKCIPLKPGEAKIWESSNSHGGKTLYRRWAIDADTINEERIVTNPDNTVRGRVITTYRSGKQAIAVSYKGMTEPWFIEQWAWGEEGGFSVVRRSFDGEVIVRQIFPSDDEGIVKTLDAEGKEITDERYKELCDETADLLF
jgi:hypothetical protein